MLRGIRTRLAVIVFAITLAAVGVVLVYVAPSLRENLRQQKLERLAADARRHAGPIRPVRTGKVAQIEPALRRAAERALELDPLNPAAFALARRAQQALIAASESATATGSPIPTQVPITEADPGFVPAPAGPTGPTGPSGPSGPSGPADPASAFPFPIPTPTPAP